MGNLEWMDHRAAKIKQRCIVKWPELPRYVRIVFVSGASLLIICSEIFFFAKQACIGSFVLGTEADNQRQIDRLSLIGFSGLFVYKSWRKQKVAPRIAAT